MRLTRLRFVVAWLLLLLSSSCAVIPEYPSQLPPLVEADERSGHCPAIAGRFRDQGTVVSTDGKLLGQISLTELVAAKPAADVVEIVGPQDDVIEIRSWRAGVQVATWRQPKFTAKMYRERGDSSHGTSYLCLKGFARLGIWYQAQEEKGEIYPVIVLSSSASVDYLWIRRAIDGSLIVHHHATGGSSVLIVPVPVYSTQEEHSYWYRFPPAQGREVDSRGRKAEDAHQQGGVVDDLVSCFSKGVRVWTRRRECDP